MKDVRWISKTEAAERLGIDLSRIRRLVAKGVLSKNAANKIDGESVQAFIEARALRDDDKDATDEPEEGGNSRFWLGQFRKAQAQLKQRELLELEGTLIRRDDARAEYLRAFDTTRQRLLEIPNAVAPALVGKTDPSDVAGIVQAALFSAMDAIASKAKEIRQAMTEKPVEAAPAPEAK